MKDTLRKYIKSCENKLSLCAVDVKLKDEIGEGGNGIVYSATLLGDEIAIKFLTSNTTGNSLIIKRERFLAEYFNVVKLTDNEGIVKYLDYDALKINDDNKEEVIIPMILMKKYEGSLKQRQKDGTEYNFIKLFEFLINTVEKVHNQGIIHRDLKPENILIDGDKYIIADFGIASYNPEIFKLRAETRPSERMANRLFSAPEQENSSVEAHKTMDIYAIGQILQWFATGSTHRGTGRVIISSIYKDSDNITIYDSIIEKCLSNKLEDRFQNIGEIREFIRYLQPKDYYDYILLFNNILRRTFPRNENGVIYSKDEKRINRLFIEIQNDLAKFDKMLWFTNGSSAAEVKLTRKNDNIWKFDDLQLNIDKIWIYYDWSLFNNFILVHFEKGIPFLFEGKEEFYEVVVDGKHNITYSELQAGYAEIDNDIVDLSKHDVELIDLPKEEGYYFICTKYNCAFISENEKMIRDFIENALHYKGKIEIDDIITLQQDIRKNKHREVLVNL